MAKFKLKVNFNSWLKIKDDMDDIRPSSELESTVHLQNQRWLIFVFKLIEKSSH